jgi:F-type H+-transporting ATPase subunit gamma
METLDALRRRIESASDLHGIVRTMKALSAASIRQFERSVEAVEAYSHTVASGMHILLKDMPPSEADSAPGSRGGTLAIIFGSDQGMCGQFNENITAFALRDLGESERIQIAIGMRAAARLQEAGSSFSEMFPVPSSVDGINPAVQSLLLKIDEWREQKTLEKVILYYNRPTSGASYQPDRVQLTPVDMSQFRALAQKKTPSRSLPMYTMESSRLLSALLHQYLFVQLYRAYARSLTSENASRLMTMQAAEKNIDERLVELNTLYHGLRQGMITSELLDIVSGVEALTSE